MGQVEPKYLAIARDIREKITEEIYPIQGLLPDGKALATQYGVSLMTLKRALDMLVAEGYLIRRRGAGTVVTNWKHIRLPNLYSLRGTRRDYGDRVETKVLCFEVHPADRDLADKLSIEEGDFIYKIIRLRIMEGRPIIMEYTYMPLEVIPGLKREQVEQSIYGYIQEQLGRKVHSAFVKVAGVRPSDLEMAEMGLGATDFLMEVEQVASLDNCRVFEYSKSHHVPDLFDFETVLFNQ